MLRPALFILTTLTAFAIGASGPATAAKHKSSSSSDVQSKAEAEIAITKKLLESGEDKGGTTTTQRRRQLTPATVPPPTPNVGTAPAPVATVPPPNVGTTNNSSSASTGSTATLGTIQQYFAQHDAPATASATLPKGTQLNVGAQVPTGVPLYPLPNDLKNQPTTSNYAYFVSGNSVVVVDSESKIIAGVYPTHH